MYYKKEHLQSIKFTYLIIANSTVTGQNGNRNISKNYQFCQWN